MDGQHLDAPFSILALPVHININRISFLASQDDGHFVTRCTQKTCEMRDERADAATPPLNRLNVVCYQSYFGHYG